MKWGRGLFVKYMYMYIQFICACVLLALAKSYHRECGCIAGKKMTDIGKNQKPMLDKRGGDCRHQPPTEAFYMLVWT